MNNELQIDEKMEIVRDYNVIATEINIIKAQTNKILLSSAVEIGKRLKEAKQLIGHGNWEKWLETEVSYSQRTAQNLMRIYEEYGQNLIENQNRNPLADLGYTQAVAMLRLDPEERENFLEDNDISAMSTRELEQAIAEKKAIEEEKNRLMKSIGDMANENERLKQQIVEADAIQKKLDELKKSSADPKELEKAKDALAKANAEIAKLRKKAADAQSEEPKVIKEVKEVIPKEVEIEMEKMRTKLSMGEDSAKFKATIDVIINLFNELIAINERIRKTDEAMADRYKEAINKVLEQLKQ